MQRSPTAGPGSGLLMETDRRFDDMVADRSMCGVIVVD